MIRSGDVTITSLRSRASNISHRVRDLKLLNECTDAAIRAFTVAPLYDSSLPCSRTSSRALCVSSPTYSIHHSITHE
eukprot:5332793-Prymnesium_polylepis.1